MIAIDGFDKECPKCENASYFSKKIFKSKWILRKEYSHTEYNCLVCGYIEGKPLSLIRDDKLKKLGIH